MPQSNANSPTDILELPLLSLTHSESVFAAGEQLLSAPWTFSNEEKVLVVRELGATNTSRALRILTSVLVSSQTSIGVDSRIEQDVHTSSHSDAVKHGGSLINAAAESVALMPIPGAFELLEQLSADQSTSVEVRAGVVWGLRLLKSSGGITLMVRSLFAQDEAVRIAAVDGLEHCLCQDPLAVSGSNREQLVSAGVALYLSGHSCVGRRAALRVLRVVDAHSVFSQVASYVDESDDLSCIHRAVELAVAISGEVAELFLSDILLRLDLPEGLYISIGKILSRTTHASVQAEVLSLKNRFSWWESLVCLLSPSAHRAHKLRSNVIDGLVASVPAVH
jgi:hypothetical protein